MIIQVTKPSDAFPQPPPKVAGDTPVISSGEVIAASQVSDPILISTGTTNPEVDAVFERDPVLLQRVYKVFSLDELPKLLAIREHVYKLYELEKIRFSPRLKEHNPTYFLDHIAFEIALIDSSLPLQDFKLRLGTNLKTIRQFAPTATHFFVKLGNFDYKAGLHKRYLTYDITDEDLELLFTNTKIRAEWGRAGGHLKERQFEEVISYLSTSIALSYFRDTQGLGEKTYKGLYGEHLLCFFNASKQLEKRLYLWIDKLADSPFESIDDGRDQSDFMSDRKLAQKALDNLHGWTEHGFIQVDEVPKYVRAYAKLFASLDSSCLNCYPAYALAALEGFSDYVLTTVLKSLNQEDASDVLTELLSNIHSSDLMETLESNEEELELTGIKVKEIKSWIKDTFLASGSVDVKNTEDSYNELQILGEMMKEVRSALSEVEQCVKEFAHTEANKMLNIDMPEELLRIAEFINQ